MSKRRRAPTDKMKEKMVTIQCGTHKAENGSVREWLDRLFAVVDSKDAAGFADYFTEQGQFVYGSGEPIQGKQAICNYVAGFFGTLESIQHTIFNAWAVSDNIFVELEVTYGLKDGRKFTLPAFDLFKMEGERIKTYLIYVDPSPMLGEA